MVLLNFFPVMGDEAFEHRKGFRHGLGSVELAVVIEGVSCVEDPPLTCIHGDCGVPAAMSGEG